MTQNVRLERPWGNGRIVGTEVTTTIGAAGGRVLLTVPAGKVFEMIGVTVDVTGSATVGNRILGLYVTGVGGANPIALCVKSGAVAAAAVGSLDISFGQGYGYSSQVRRARILTADVVGAVTQSLPIKYLQAGQTIVVDDYANIDTADVVVAYLQYIEYDV